MSGHRVGTGYDSHRLVAGRPLVLGGVTVPFERGLEGHSDGDCLVHSLCDALLGAAAAGDLGSHFPSTDPRWSGASSLDFLKAVATEVSKRRLALENADATVIAEAPPLAPYLNEMRDVLSRVLGVAREKVSIKAKSNDGLGALGRGEGIAAQTVVLLRSQE